MLTIFRFLQNFSKKEHEAFTRYGREHPHFLLFLGLDAVLSVVLVGGGYAYVANDNSSKSEAHRVLESGGGKSTLDEVKLHMRKHGLSLYWLGSKGTKKFAVDVANSNSATLIYLEDSSSKPKFSDPILIVETFQNKKDFDRMLRGPVMTTLEVRSINSRGDLVTFNRSDLSRAVVTLAKSSKLIVLKYSEPQEESNLISDSEKLVPLT